MFGKKQENKRLIFIVEDNTMYAKTLQQYLLGRFPEAEIRIFPVAELCMDNLHLGPDVVIMDNELNTKYFDAVNGLEMTKEIHEKNPKIKLILLSGQVNLDEALKIIRTGGIHYVDKNDQAFAHVADIIG